MASIFEKLNLKERQEIVVLRVPKSFWRSLRACP